MLRNKLEAKVKPSRDDKSGPVSSDSTLGKPAFGRLPWAALDTERIICSLDYFLLSYRTDDVTCSARQKIYVALPLISAPQL